MELAALPGVTQPWPSLVLSLSSVAPQLPFSLRGNLLWAVVSVVALPYMFSVFERRLRSQRGRESLPSPLPPTRWTPARQNVSGITHEFLDLTANTCLPIPRTPLHTSVHGLMQCPDLAVSRTASPSDKRFSEAWRPFSAPTGNNAALACPHTSYVCTHGPLLSLFLRAYGVAVPLSSWRHPSNRLTPARHIDMPSGRANLCLASDP